MQLDYSRRTLGWLFLGLVLLGLLLLFCLWRDSRLIERSLTQQGRLALQGAGHDPAALTFSGRDASLQGVAPSDAVRAEMEAIVQGVRGVRRVDNDLRLEAPARNPNVDIRTEDGKVVLSGLVPETARAQLIEAASELYGADNVVDQLEFAPDVAKASWLAGLLGFLPSLNAVERAHLSATNDSLELSGIVPDEAQREALAARAAEAVGLAVQNKLELAALQQPEFSLKLVDGRAELSGRLAETSLQAALAAVMPALGAENLSNQLQTDAGVLEPVWLGDVFKLVPELAGEVEALELSYRDARLTVGGIVAAEGQREAIFQRLQGAAPGVAVVNALEVVPLTEARFNLRVAEDGVVLNGNVDAETASALSAVATAINPNVDNELLVAERMATPEWFPGLIQRLPGALAEVQNPQLEVSSRAIDILGTVQSEVQKEELVAALGSALPAGITLNNRLELAPLAAPRLDLQQMASGLSLKGELSPASATQLTDALAALPDLALVNELSVLETIATPDWLSLLLGRVPDYLSEVKSAGLSLTEDTLSLRGIVKSESKKAELITRLGADLSPAVKLENNLQVVPDPAQVNLELRADALELSGTVAPETAERLRGLSERLAMPLQNNLVESAEVAPSDWLADLLMLLPAYRNDLTGRFEATGNTLRLEGVVRSEAKKAELEAELAELSEAGLSIATRLELAPQAPELRFEMKDGQLKLAGTVSEQTREAVALLAKPLAGTVVNELEAAANVTSPEWLPEVLELIPDYSSKVQEAGLELKDDTLTLMGKVFSEAIKTELGESFARAAPGVTVNNQLELAELQAPQFSLSVADGINLKGTVSEQTSEALIEASTHLELAVVNELETATNVASPTWLAEVLELVPSYTNGVEEASLEFKDETLTLAGKVSSEEVKAEMGASFAEAAGSDVSVANQLEVTAAEVPPPDVTEGVAETAAEAEVETETNTSEAPEGAETSPDVVLAEIPVASVEPALAETPAEAAMTAETPEEAASAPAEAPAGEEIPVTQEPTTEEPIGEENEGALVAEPGVEEAVLESVVEEPVAEEPVRESSPDAEHPAGATVLVPEPVSEAPVIREAVAETELTVEPLAGETVSNENPAEEPIVAEAARTEVEVPSEPVQESTDTEAAEISTETLEAPVEAETPEASTSEAVVSEAVVSEAVSAAEEAIAQVPATATPSESPANQTVAETLKTVAQEPAAIAAETAPEPPLEPPRLSLGSRGNTIQLAGDLAQADAQKLVETLSALPGQSLINQASTTAEVASPEWLPGLIEAMPSYLEQVDNAGLELENQHLRLTGEVASQEAKEALALAMQAVGEGLAIENQLEVVQPVVQPAAEARKDPEPPAIAAEAPQNLAESLQLPKLRIDIAKDNVRLAGTLPDTYRTQDIATSFSGKTIENSLLFEADVASPEYLPKAIELGARVASDLDLASLVLEAQTLTLLGTADNQEQRDAIAAYVNEAVSPPLTVINRLSVKPSIPFSEDGK